MAYVWSVHTTPAGCLDDMSESRGLLPCMKSDGRRKDPEYKAILSSSHPPLAPLSGTDGLLSGLQISTLAAESARPCKPS